MKLIIKNRYWIVPNDLLNNSNISWKAKWLFAYLQSKPDDWEFAVERMKDDSKDWRDWTNNGLRELEELGYLERNKRQNEKWLWEREYTLYDEVVTEKPSTEKPSTDNTWIKKERDTKKDIYIELFDFRLSKDIVVHNKITTQIKSKIDTLIKEWYTLEDLKRWLATYAEVYHSELTYWTHKRTLDEYLGRTNWIRVFMDKTVDDFLIKKDFKSQVVKDDAWYLKEYDRLKDNRWEEFKAQYWEELYRKYKKMFKDQEIEKFKSSNLKQND